MKIKINNQEQRDQILNSLAQLCHKNSGVKEAEPECWPKTRDIADLSGTDIYSARYFLNCLFTEGKIKSSEKPIKKSLRWFYVCGAKNLNNG